MTLPRMREEDAADCIVDGRRWREYCTLAGCVRGVVVQSVCHRARCRPTSFSAFADALRFHARRAPQRGSQAAFNFKASSCTATSTSERAGICEDAVQPPRSPGSLPSPDKPTAGHTLPHSERSAWFSPVYIGARLSPVITGRYSPARLS